MEDWGEWRAQNHDDIINFQQSKNQTAKMCTTKDTPLVH